MSSLPPSSQRVEAAARAAGLDIRIVEMPQSTRTAEEAARACGCEVAQIVKSLIFLGSDSGKAYLLLVSGENRVDEPGIADHLGEALTRPNGETVRRRTGFAIGGIPPIGNAEAMPVIMDTRLLDFDVVWAAAGTPRCVFSADPKALRAATGARLLDFLNRP